MNQLCKTKGRNRSIKSKSWKVGNDLQMKGHYKKSWDFHIQLYTNKFENLN